MSIDWNNVSEIMLEGISWNSTFRDQWYKITKFTDKEIFFDTQLGVRSAHISMICDDGYRCQLKYKNPLLSKLNSL